MCQPDISDQVPANAGEGLPVKDVAAAILNVILLNFFKLRYVNEMHISRYKVYHVNSTHQTIRRQQEDIFLRRTMQNILHFVA